MTKTKNKSLLLTLGTVLAVLLALLGGVLLTNTKTVSTESTAVVKADEPTIVQSGDGWTLNSEGVLYIGKTAAETSYATNTYNRPWSSYKASIYEVVIDDTAEYIYGRALNSCYNVRKITMPSIPIKAVYSSNWTDVNHIAFLFDRNSSTAENLGSIYVSSGSYRMNVYMEPSVKEIVITSGQVRNYWLDKLSSVERIDLGGTSGNIGRSGYGGLFSDCSSLQQIVFPQNCTTLHYSAFEGCSSLESITIPASIVNVVDQYNSSKGFSGVFKGCTSLTTIAVEAGNTVFDSRDNCNAIIKTATNELLVGADPSTIPSGVVSIANSAFEGRSGSASTVVLPSSINSIGQYAFKDCTGITSITIPNTIEHLDTMAFNRCSFESVTYSKTVQNKYSFVDGEMTVLSNDKDWLEIPDELVLSIDFDSNVTNIDYSFGSYTYSYERLYWVDETTKVKYLKTRTDNYFAVKGVGDDTLTSYTINNSTKFIMANAFNNCRALTEMVIPDSVVCIGAGAFCWCNAMQSITLPENLVYIGSNVFCRCEALTTIDIPESVLEIGGYAFQYCVALETVTGGESVTSIGEYAFRNCSELTAITGTTLLNTIGGYAFQGCSNIESLAVSNNVVEISASAFEDCEKLVWSDDETNVKYLKTTTNNYFGVYGVVDSTLATYEINENAVLILSGAFGDCDNLTSIAIPNSVKSVGSGAFSSALESVELGTGLTKDCAAYTLASDGTLTIHEPCTVEDADAICTEVVLKAIISEDVDEEIANRLSFTHAQEVSLPSNWGLDYFGTMFGDNMPTIYYHGDALPEFTSECSTTFFTAETDPETGDSHLYGSSSFIIYVPDENYAEFESICAVFRLMCLDYDVEAYFIILPMSLSSNGKLSLTESGNAIYAGNAQNPYLVLVKEVDGSATEFEVDSKTKIVGSFVFYTWEGNALQGIDIPDSVEYINTGAFMDCTNLTTLGIGRNVKYIGLGAFSFSSETPDELPTLTVNLRKASFASSNEAEQFAIDLILSLTDKHSKDNLYDYYVYGDYDENYGGAFEYVIGDREGYNDGNDNYLNGATLRPVVINYYEELPAVFAETLESVVVESGSESVTLNPATSEELGILPTEAPATGVAALGIVLPVAFIAVVLAATVVVWKRKEQY